MQSTAVAAPPEGTPPLRRTPTAGSAVRKGGGARGGKKMTQAQFRRYLERSGVVDVVEEMLGGLFAQQEKPKTALEFLRENEGLFSEMIGDRE